MAADAAKAPKEAPLKASEARLRLATETARLGVFEWDADSGSTVWANRLMYVLFGRDPGRGPLSFAEFMEQVIHPEDRERFEREAAQARGSGEPLHVQFRIRRESDGQWRWLECVGQWRPATGTSGVGLTGVVADVTERKALNEMLAEMAERERARAEELSALMEATPAVVWIARDPQCRLVTGSRAAHELLRIPSQRNLSMSLPHDERPAHFRVFIGGEELTEEALPLQVAARGVEVLDCEEELRFEDGTRLFLYGNAVPLHDGRGRVSGAIAAFVDITERKHAEEALRDADRRKDEFLAMLAHELRNPLAAIGLATEILDRLRPHQEGAQAAIDIVKRQMVQLGRVVDDLLDVARATHGKLVLARRPLDLAALARAAAAAAPLPTEVEGDPAWVDADPARVQQMLENLLDNAAKYGASRAKVGVRASGGEVEVTVADNGQGIPASLLPHLFEPFVQGEQSLERTQGGLGLGLALVQRLAALHGGAVSAASEGPGRGATFTLRLPRIEAPGSAAAEPAGAATRRRRVLVVEDEADSRESLRLLLEMEGHEVRVAADGAEGLERLREFRPEVALVDIGLPGIDGYEFARRARALDAGASAKLVALTGYGQEKDRQRAGEAGFDLHLVKPVAYRELQKAFG